MLASRTIFDAAQKPITTTLNALLVEYEFPENSLEGLAHVLKALAHYNIELDPPHTEYDLDHIRTLKPKKASSEIVADIQSIIEGGGENHSVELKSSIRIDRNRQQHDPGKPIGQYLNEKLGTKLCQEICAFLNRQGGVILLGVANDLSISGCDDDFHAFQGDNTPEDKADLILRQLIEKNFTKPSAVLSRIQVDCVEFEAKRVVALRIAPSRGLSLLKENCGSPCQLYLRIGTSAQPIKMEELEEYFDISLLID